MRCKFRIIPNNSCYFRFPLNLLAVGLNLTPQRLNSKDTESDKSSPELSAIRLTTCVHCVNRTEPGAAHNCSCKCQKDDDCSCSCTTTDARDAEKKACNKSPVSRKGRAAERQNSPEDKEIDARNMEKMSQCLEVMSCWNICL